MQTIATAIRTWSIYCLLEGRHVRYIGITSQRPERRLLQHYADASRKRTDHKTNWIRHCLAEGIPIEIRVVKSGLLREKAERSEVRLLRFFRKSFRLVNSHEGGASGYAGLSLESKLKHAESGRARYLDPKRRAAARLHMVKINKLSVAYWKKYRKLHPKPKKPEPRFIIKVRNMDTKEIVTKFPLRSLRDCARRLAIVTRYLT